MDFTSQIAKNQRNAKKKVKKSKKGKPSAMDTSDQYYFMGKWYKSKDAWNAAQQKHYAAVEKNRKA